MATSHQPPFVTRHGAQPQPAPTGFNAMGQPIPLARRQAAYETCQSIGLTDREEMMRCVTGMAEQLERDKPFEAQQIAMQHVDLTGAYRLMAVLLTDPDDNT